MFDQSLSHARRTGNPFIWQLEQITTQITHARGVWVWTAGGHILTRNKPAAIAHTEDAASRATRELALFYRLYVLSHHIGPWWEWTWRIVGEVIALINVQWWHTWLLNSLSAANLIVYCRWQLICIVVRLDSENWDSEETQQFYFKRAWTLGPPHQNVNHLLSFQNVWVFWP